MSFPAELSAAAQAVEARLAAAIQALPDSRVRAAMAHGIHGGKGLRGYLVLESAALHDVPREAALNAAAAIEAMHAYSLVHDDLPAMDDDDLRRGRPTAHIAFDEATAILAGDALQALAFELCAQPEQPQAAALTLKLAQAAGAAGMVLGQALDIAAETAATPLSLQQITALQNGKTGALFNWACTAGPLMADADPAPLAAYAKALGLAFQITDDILDTEGNAETAGKRLQKDAEAGKATFVSLLGLEAARARAQDLITEACDALAPYGKKAESLRSAARFVISRDK
ncbi:polyprenyl synthetase family protein [Pararhodobacter oceanensis]|uniref:Geranylgeranyl diphosphate synthase n=1 Tax=Pararhodobacter oceanensis TaxID=2172121 RepID=A0A2T8HS93_9RHOB|nr:polyprenyl synthetase family protein [Pararhodobacter oceanensis]PVH28310.1 farnesyl-diphosphate synthase [Pararhodobacter oceanensis]